MQGKHVHVGIMASVQRGTKNAKMVFGQLYVPIAPRLSLRNVMARITIVMGLLMKAFCVRLGSIVLLELVLNKNVQQFVQ
jgi:hypothetical protein